MVPFNSVVSAGPYNSYIYTVDSTRCVNPSIIRLNNDVLVTAYSGSGADGYIKTIGISSNGSANTIIDTWVFDIGTVKDAKLSVRANLITIAYINLTQVCYIKTFTITDSGLIIKAFLDTYYFSYVSRIDDLMFLRYNNQIAITYTRSGESSYKAYNLFRVMTIDGNGIIESVYYEFAHVKTNGQTHNISSMCSVYAGSNYELILVATLFRYTALLSNMSIVVFNMTTTYTNIEKHYYNLSSVISSVSETYNNTELIKTNIGEFSTKFVFAYSHMDVLQYVNIITFEVLNTGVIGTDFYIYHYANTQPLGGLLKINDNSTAVEIALFSGATNSLYLWRINISKQTNLVLTQALVKAYSTGISLYYSVAIFSHIGVIVAINSRTSTGIAVSMFNFPNYDFTQDEYPGADEYSPMYCGYDMSLYNNVKQDDLINFFPSQWTGKNIEDQYMIPLTTTIQGVGILITALQYSYDSNIDNYFLNLNGFIVTADCIFEYNPGTYMVFWRTYAVLTNQKPTFAFRHEISMPGGAYWEYYINPSYSSTNLEFPKFSTSMEIFGDHVFNGNDYKYYSGELKSGLMMTFWYGEIHIENGTSPYNDMITTTKTDWIQYDNVPIIWQVNSAIYPYIIQVWHNGTQIINPYYPFPYNIPTGLWSGRNSYVPIKIGDYQFRLLYNGVKTKSVNISVTHSLQSDFIMYVYPNPCEFNKEFKIGYRYYPSDGAEGLITIDPARSIVYSDAQKFFVLTANTSGNLTWTGLANYWISMYKKVGSVYYSIPAVPDIYLSITDLLNPNTLNLDYYTKTIDAGTSFTQRYYGTHGYYGQNVYITLDNVIVGQNVGYSFYYSTTSEVSTDGAHIAKLVLQTVNGTIELANKTFTVIITPTGEGGEPSDPWTGILGDYKYVFAVGIVVMFLILPMTIASKLGVELPMIANLGSAGLGLAFCTLSGLLPLYVIFITVVAMVVGAVVIIFTR
jgi:hypothetical protein